MPSPYLILAFLLATSFTLATQLGAWREQSDHFRSHSGSVLEALMGDSRRLFANHFFVQADVYLHSGVYPSIFDQPQTERKSHLSQAATPGEGAQEHEHHAGESDHEDSDVVSTFLGKPKDWVDAFGRNFFPTHHTHLEKNTQREVLPWLEMAAELNPNQVETYTVAAYWLRSHLGKSQEAEEFLRQGWRANPDSFEIIFELARLYQENRHDIFRARNLYELALRKWQQSESTKADPDQMTYMQITAYLARLEEGAGNWDKAVTYLEMLRNVSPRPQVVQQQIDELKARSKSSAPSTPSARQKP